MTWGIVNQSAFMGHLRVLIALVPRVEALLTSLERGAMPIVLVGRAAIVLQLSVQICRQKRAIQYVHVQ